MFLGKGEGEAMRLLKRYRPEFRALPFTVSGRARFAAWVAARRLACFAPIALMFAATPVLHASVSLLLEQPYGKLNLIEPAGHSAIYLDHVCAETPLKLRPCHAGELGVVVSRYDGIGNHDWIAVPLIPYLYAVSSAAEIPQTMDRAEEERLRDAYRRQNLESVAPDGPAGSVPAGNWYELIGSALDRTIYGFRVNTTPAQDARFIAKFNDSRNVEQYDGAFRNCADFARVVLNDFYPHAVRRDYIADLGMTSPKSVARNLSHYAHKHPKIGLEVFVIPQVKGDLPRSHSNNDLAEYILKRYGVPLGVLSPVSTAVVFAAYVGHGRFAMPKHAPLLNLNEIASGNPRNLNAGASPQRSPPLSRDRVRAAQPVRTLSMVGSAAVPASLLLVEKKP
jgi:hypothetical protein